MNTTLPIKQSSEIRPPSAGNLRAYYPFAHNTSIDIPACTRPLSQELLAPACIHPLSQELTDS